MGSKNYSVILNVDLSCTRCQEKIKKILNKYQDRWGIQSVVWDEKTDMITLTGPFCPHKLAKRLRRKAGKIIKAIDIPDSCECDEEKPKRAEPPKPETPKPAPTPSEPESSKPAPPPASPAPKPETPKPAPTPSEPESSKPAPPPASPAPKPETPKPAPSPKTEPPKPSPAPPPPKPQPVAPEFDPVAPVPYSPVWPVYFCGPCCRCGSGGWYDPCACGCGRGCGLPPDLGYGRPCVDGGSRCEFFCEEDSVCRPM